MTALEHQHLRRPSPAAAACPGAPPQRRGRSRRGSAAGLLLVVLAASGALLPAGAGAAPDWRRGVQEQLEPNNLVRPAGITLEQAANEVRRQTGGRVLSASPTERGGERGYDIRVLLEGKRVRSYFVDDQGRVLSRD